jgi:cell division protein FtsI/penicillin-binding protein 2
MLDYTVLRLFTTVCFQGEDGVETILADSAGRELQSNSTTQKEAVSGNDVVTTIDSVMQYYAEEAVYNAYKKNDAKRVIAVVSDRTRGSACYGSLSRI